MSIFECYNDAQLNGWKLAADGKWEEAIDLPAKPTDTHIIHLQNWVQNHGTDVAIEAFFKTPENETVFLGFRLSALSKEEQARFVSRLVTLIKKENFPSPLFILRNANFLLSQTLLPGSEITEKESPDKLELGVEGLWKTAGSYVVWSKEENRAPDDVKDLENKAPHLLRAWERAIMLEYAWSAPLPHWLGVQCSDFDGQNWRFSTERYLNLTADFDF